MGHLFLDVETYIAKENTDTALNPYHGSSKILAIAYNYYDTYKPPVKAEIKQPVLLKEWEFGERQMLMEFFTALQGMLAKDPNMNIHRFNILKFDLPYLFGRMRVHGIAAENELHKLLYRNGTDMMHLAAVLSDEGRVKEALWGIGQKEVNRFFGLQVSEGTGLECSLHYDNKEYDQLVERVTREFNFEQLMNSFYLYAKRLQEGKELNN